ncbi:MAG: hypothetical protein GX030_09210 [Firmicutes bacterium]|nr:hypothetical protein [Bacillota bacterium]
MQGQNLLKVYGFGQFRVEIGNRVLSEQDWTSKKALDMFKYLLLYPGHAVADDTLIEILWPEIDEEKGKRRLYDTVYRLRSIIDVPGADTYIVKGVTRYSLNPQKQYWFDWREFEEHYHRVFKFRTWESPEEERSLLERGIEPYRGPLLPSDIYQDWTETHRQTYRDMFLDMLLRLAGILQQQGESARALTQLKRGIGEDRFREDFYILGLEILAAQNNLSEAIHLYRHYEKVMEDELGIPPSVRVRQIVEDLDDQGGDLRDLLSSAQIEAGAMVCRYEVFRSICEVEIRRLSRQEGKSILLTVKMAQPLASQDMETLVDNLRQELRRGDVITHRRLDTLYVLLYGTSLDQRRAIARRIQRWLSPKVIGTIATLQWQEITAAGVALP